MLLVQNDIYLRKIKTEKYISNKTIYKMIFQFTKMQGAGNDYIYVDTSKCPIADPIEKAQIWSAYHTGIGSDGLVLIEPSEVADFKMRIFNADGSEAMMCGNASRCIGKYVYEKGLTQKKVVSLETLSGIKYLQLHINIYNKVESVTVDMGEPQVFAKELPLSTEKETYTGSFVSMGNPHYVLEVDDISRVDLPMVGPLLEHHPYFKDRANIEFSQRLADGSIRMRVWERGSGITMACGTGACATAVAYIALDKMPFDKEVPIVMDGGQLSILWSSKDNHVYMTGAAEIVFEGTIEG